jgi:RNA polymerase sigma factor (TIGR02999 family)
MVPDPESSQGEATRLLRALAPGRGGAGDGPEAERLWELVYDTLRGLANRMLAAERGGHTLQPTALANEAYMRLIQQDQVQWQDRAHFLAIAAKAMRRILVDHARGVKRAKRGGGWDRVELQSGVLGPDGDDGRLDLVAVHEALERLGERSERKARLVELRFFAGLTMEEVSHVMEVPLSTLEREWRFCKAWLARELGGEA